MDVGVSYHTIMEYYIILQDCMLVDVIEPLIVTNSRKRLTKSVKYILADLGIKRVGADEPYNPGVKQFLQLFEQYIGLEISKMLQVLDLQAKLLFWRSHDGPEVDYVIAHNQKYTPVEVKWTDAPTNKDINHLLTFKNEYPIHDYCYVICRCPAPMLIADKVLAMPWQELPNIITNLKNIEHDRT